jgi:hypothetical protein
VTCKPTYPLFKQLKSHSVLKSQAAMNLKKTQVYLTESGSIPAKWIVVAFV